MYQSTLQGQLSSEHLRSRAIRPTHIHFVFYPDPLEKKLGGTAAEIPYGLEWNNNAIESIT